VQPPRGRDFFAEGSRILYCIITSLIAVLRRQHIDRQGQLDLLLREKDERGGYGKVSGLCHSFLVVHEGCAKFASGCAWGGDKVGPKELCLDDLNSS
jgi:hypothetical protein